MRQHVNPLSSNFNQIKRIPSLNKMFGDPNLNLHLDIGCAAGEFLFDLALVNNSWNYLGIEIREKLVKNAKLKVIEREIKNLYFIFGNANNILNDVRNKFIIKNLKSISFYFPDPWFKKRHYKRRIIQPDFINYSQQVIKNAKVLASTLINRGINIVSGGTDNHIVLLDLRSINMTGKIADLLVSEVNITANKNTVPFDPESPFVTSGLRLGTAALTTRGFNEDAFAEVGEIIADRLLNPDDSLIESQCKERVLTLCNRFPLYEGKLEASIK